MNSRSSRVSSVVEANHKGVLIHALIQMFSLLVNSPGLNTLTPRQIAALLYIKTGGTSRTVKQLATDLGMPRAAASRVAMALGSAGLIGRMVDSRDRRVILLTLTEAGEVALDALLIVFEEARLSIRDRWFTSPR
jgi:DNA-binding MarR family transcriptional regulator